MITLQLLTAPWCKACHAVLPLVQRTAQKDKIGFEEIDLDAHPEFGSGVTQLPVLRILRDDEEIGHLSGIFGIGQIEDMVHAAREPA